MTQIVHFHAWSLQVNSSATAAAYSKLASGEAECCGCLDCRNWIESREDSLPPTFVAFLQELGVDRRKETEVSEYEGGAIDPNMNLYSGEFLFHGRVLSGPDCYQPHSDGKGAAVVLSPFEGIRVGLSSNTKWAMRGPASAKFHPSESCAVVVFQVHVPRGSAYGEASRIEA